ncbi:hypothetical protein RB195_002616 [Necator americanus]|uniref:Reverse transcriptase domain-containing protein n=1 Tax=Necator americanus TaxID=51031 RepID=A0ABR1DJW2_NECAM
MLFINVEGHVQQVETISRKIFTAIPENVLPKLEWNDMGGKDVSRQRKNLRFADNIVLITSNASQAERLLTDLEEAYENIGIQLNLQKTIFRRN